MTKQTWPLSFRAWSCILMVHVSFRHCFPGRVSIMKLLLHCVRISWWPPTFQYSNLVFFPPTFVFNNILLSGMIGEAVFMLWVFVSYSFLVFFFLSFLWSLFYLRTTPKSLCLRPVAMRKRFCYKCATAFCLPCRCTRWALNTTLLCSDNQSEGPGLSSPRSQQPVRWCPKAT